VSLNAASLPLNNGLKALRQNWDAARQRWDDAVARDFEKDYWIPLRGQVDALLVAMDRLGPILDRAVRECS
jgi:hypothetical protein